MLGMAGELLKVPRLGHLDTGLLSRQPCEAHQVEVNACGPCLPPGHSTDENCVSLMTKPPDPLIIFILQGVMCVL